MNGIRRCELQLEPMIDCGSARTIGPVMMKLTDDDFLVNDANHLLTGIHQSARGMVITVIVARNPDIMLNGMGLVYQLSADQARDIAAGLIDLAEQIERAAADQAANALARAARLGPTS